MPQRFEIKSVTHEPNRIMFEWNDTGGMYHVYKDGNHIYEGTSADFQDTDLTPNKLYNYTIERHAEDVVKDVIVMQTSALSIEKNLENSLQSLVFTTIIAKSQIALSWECLKDVEMYTIYRDGEELAQVEANRFIDRDFPTHAPVTYAIYCERSIAESEETFNNARSLVAKVLGVFYPKTSQKKSSVEGYTMMKTIQAPSKLLIPVSDYRNPDSINSWRFLYKTFLEDEVLENPNVLSPNRYFEGDNRKFDPESRDFRTFVEVEVDYRNTNNPLKFTKEVGESVALGLDKKVRERQTASDEGIQIERLEHGSDEVGFNLKHAVGNPLTTAPDINYEVQAVFRKNGVFDISGFHDQSPDHEVYLRSDKASEWVPVHQSRSEGLAYMAGVTAYQYWRYSNM
ncbi:DUF3238 domain-containing protein [Sporosarcina aquimarina]|uniref:DUF3238 domain-containing protein n=1 Tax=Sporosarcina aquimarina TaxID=114975 RepID=A0ABU4G0V0_9BACL|nr:DUF3238 domain-containing protein [Sporosarcina aquimarina]MDW0109943.1 DUF3238 domain-containing protein [Sporosarcina aquimarina]